MDNMLPSVGGLGSSALLNTKIPSSPDQAQTLQKVSENSLFEKKSAVLNAVNISKKEAPTLDEINLTVNGSSKVGNTPPLSDQLRNFPNAGPLSNENVISQLPEGKLATILAQVSALKENKASSDEIKDRIDTFLKENDVKPPNMGGTFVDTLA